jgi:hypothetical protein
MASSYVSFRQPCKKLGLLSSWQQGTDSRPSAVIESRGIVGEGVAGASGYRTPFPMARQKAQLALDAGAQTQADRAHAAPHAHAGRGLGNGIDVDITRIAAGDNNIGNVDIVTMPNCRGQNRASLPEAGGFPVEPHAATLVLSSVAR